MAVRNPRMKHNAFCGRLSDPLIESILKIREMESVPNFKNTIFNFPVNLIVEALNDGKGVREYIKANGIEYKQYIGELRDSQTVGAAFMYTSPRSIIGDGVGRGKTVEVCALLNILKSKKELKGFIMAVEKTAQMQTLMEVLSKTGLNVINLPPEKAKMERMLKVIDWENMDGVIITHSALTSNTFLSWLSEYAVDIGLGVSRCTLFDTLIVDESSIFKNEKNVIYSATREICKLMSRVHFMNATVFETSIMDIYNQVDLLDDTILPSRTRIKTNYCVEEQRSYWVNIKGKPQQKFKYDVVDYKNQDEFKERLKLFYLARHFEDTTNKYTLVEVYPTTAQLDAIQKGCRYQEVLNCPSLIKDDRIKIPFTRESLPKLDKALQICENNKDKRIMIYCFYRDVQAYIKKEVEDLGLKCVVLNGDVNKAEDRQRIINEFNTGESTVIVTNIKKSINLWNGDICIIMTLEANPAKLEQIRGRIDRHVDDKLKEYYMIVCKGTPEYRLFNEKLKKRGQDSKELTVDARSAIDYFIDGDVDEDFSALGD